MSGTGVLGGKPIYVPEHASRRSAALDPLSGAERREPPLRDGARPWRQPTSAPETAALVSLSPPQPITQLTPRY